MSERCMSVVICNQMYKTVCSECQLSSWIVNCQFCFLGGIMFFCVWRRSFVFKDLVFLYVSFVFWCHLSGHVRRSFVPPV